MRIALNTRFLIEGKMEGFGWYTYEICKRLTENHPEHTFYLFFDRAFDSKFVFGDNCIPLVLHPPARHPILFKIWFDFSVTRALKKHKIDLFFSPDGYLSQLTKTPQVNVIHDLNFEHYPEDLPKVQLNYYKKYFPRFSKIAKEIITVSEFSKQDIVTRYNIDPKKVHAIWNGVNPSFVPINEIEKQLIKEQFSEGSDYFLFVGSLHPRKNVHRLIEAFLAFKKESQSATKLLIVGAPLWNKLPDVSEIKHSEIQFTGRLDLAVLTKVVAAAKALTFIPYFEGFGIPMVEAMKCGTPVIAANTSCLPEVAGEAAMYVNPFSIESIKAGLLQMDIDAKTREALSIKGIDRATKFSWDTAAKEIAKVLNL